MVTPQILVGRRLRFLLEEIEIFIAERPRFLPVMYRHETSTSFVGNIPLSLCIARTSITG